MTIEVRDYRFVHGPEFIERIERKPIKLGTGWHVNYKGRRYRLMGGENGRYFIRLEKP